MVTSERFAEELCLKEEKAGLVFKRVEDVSTHECGRRKHKGR